MAILTQSAKDLWGLHNADWNADLASGVITFTNTEMGLIVTAPLQVIGTYDIQDCTWLWGWNHPSVAEQLGAYATLASDMGWRHRLPARSPRLRTMLGDSLLPLVTSEAGRVATTARQATFGY